MVGIDQTQGIGLKIKVIPFWAQRTMGNITRMSYIDIE